MQVRSRVMCLLLHGAGSHQSGHCASNNVWELAGTLGPPPMLIFVWPLSLPPSPKITLKMFYQDRVLSSWRQIFVLTLRLKAARIRDMTALESIAKLY